MNANNQPQPYKHGIAGKNTRLVAYLRGCPNKPLEVQRREIEAYCHEQGYHIVNEYIDQHGPGPALQEMFQHLDKVDGVIASDLNRFVEHPSNRARDLRPLLHSFLTQRWPKGGC
jgi:DNA invertase Pin-like site-specific DNA recombinase